MGFSSKKGQKWDFSQENFLFKYLTGCQAVKRVKNGIAA